MIYLDHSATTPMFKECLDFFNKYGCEDFYNPSALYAGAMQIGKVVNGARKDLAEVLGVEGDEILFTASGTESDNIAFFSSTIRKNGKILVGNAEHSAVYNCAVELKNRGYNVEFVNVDRFGKIIYDDFISKLDESVSFVSVMHVNNETGAVNDIKKLCSAVKEKNPKAIFHADGVQAFCKIPLNLYNLGVDLYSISGHKINAPKGVGALFIKRGISLKPFVFGGGQEKNIRSATENVSAITAFAYCAKRHSESLKENLVKKSGLIEYAHSLFIKAFYNIAINTDLKNSVGNILNFSFKDVRGEVMLHAMEKRGIIIGTGSACSAGKGLRRIPNDLGIKSGFDAGMLRISVSADNDENEIRKAVEIMKEEYEILKRYNRV